MAAAVTLVLLASCSAGDPMDPAAPGEPAGLGAAPPPPTLPAPGTAADAQGAGGGGRGRGAAAPATAGPPEPAAPRTGPGPSDLAIPQPVPDGLDGEVLAAAQRPAQAGAVAWDVLYRSRGLDGAPVVVSGIVVRPDRPAPAGGFPVVTWGHPTTGAADACAPSGDDQVPVPALDELLAAGFVVAATDYEGLGTPGTHPYLVGESAGRSLLDAARAAGRLEGADAGTRVLAWGSSQGGHAALFAGEIAGRYAPELDLLGVAAASPPSDLPALVGTATQNPVAFGLAFLALVTWADVYADADLTDVVVPEVAQQAAAVESVCLPELLTAFTGRAPGEPLVADPRRAEPWATLLARNSPGRAAPGAPVLLLHGDADPIVPVPLTEGLAGDLCAFSGPVSLRRYPGAGHGDAVLAAALDDLLTWFADRADGLPAPTTC